MQRQYQDNSYRRPLYRNMRPLHWNMGWEHHDDLMVLFDRDIVRITLYYKDII